jgi:hypothetical protein
MDQKCSKDGSRKESYENILQANRRKAEGENLD